YVKDGGSLLATFESSRYSEWGEPRNDFQLADLFDAHVTGDVIGPHGNSYARIEARHPVLEGFNDTALLPGAENRVPISTAVPLTLSVVPAYPALSPEMGYPRPHRPPARRAGFHAQGK